MHLAPSRLCAPTGAATCSSPAHDACALRHRDRMAPVVVAANSRCGYSCLPTEQRVTASSCSARAQRSRESPTRCRMVAVVPMRTYWSRPAATVATPMAPMDGSNGTEASDCVDVPPARLCDRPRCERRPWIESLGSAGCVAVAAASDQDALVRRRAIARRPKHHSNSRAVERTGTLVVRAGTWQRARSSVQAGGGATRAQTHSREVHAHTTTHRR